MHGLGGAVRDVELGQAVVVTARSARDPARDPGRALPVHRDRQGLGEGRVALPEVLEDLLRLDETGLEGQIPGIVHQGHERAPLELVADLLLEREANVAATSPIEIGARPDSMSVEVEELQLAGLVRPQEGTRQPRLVHPHGEVGGEQGGDLVVLHEDRQGIAAPRTQGLPCPHRHDVLEIGRLSDPLAAGADPAGLLQHDRPEHVGLGAQVVPDLQLGARPQAVHPAAFEDHPVPHHPSQEPGVVLLERPPEGHPVQGSLGPHRLAGALAEDALGDLVREPPPGDAGPTALQGVGQEVAQEALLDPHAVLVRVGVLVGQLLGRAGRQVHVRIPPEAARLQLDPRGPERRDEILLEGPEPLGDPPGLDRSTAPPEAPTGVARVGDHDDPRRDPGQHPQQGVHLVVHQVVLPEALPAAAVPGQEGRVVGLPPLVLVRHRGAVAREPEDDLAVGPRAPDQKVGKGLHDGLVGRLLVPQDEHVPLLEAEAVPQQGGGPLHVPHAAVQGRQALRVAVDAHQQGEAVGGREVVPRGLRRAL